MAEQTKIEQFEPLRITEEARCTIRDFLRNKLLGDGEGCCLFRRFDRLFTSNNPPISITRHFGPDVYETLESVQDIPGDTMKKSIEVRFKYFSGFTDARQIRDEHANLMDKEIYLHSSNYRQVDMSLGYTFTFSDARPLSLHTAPYNGDLIFIFLSNKTLSGFQSEGKNKKIKPKADKWCIVSEQFLHAWTLIQYDWHDSFDKIIAYDTPKENREVALREKMFVGNRLMTNSWLKRKLCLAATGDAMSVEESRDKYWHLRTEYVSRKWVDVYVALVLIARYGELPCPVNAPKTNSENKEGKDVSSRVWSLPDVFVTGVLHNCCVNDSKAGLFLITNHLINYNLWRDYSKSSMMFSIYGQKHQKGFFDDIHQVKFSDIVSQSGTVFLRPQSGGSAIGKTYNAADFANLLHNDPRQKSCDFNFHCTEIGEETLCDECPDTSLDVCIPCDTWASIVKSGSKRLQLQLQLELPTVNTNENICEKIEKLEKRMADSNVEDYIAALEKEENTVLPSGELTTDT